LSDNFAGLVNISPVLSGPSITSKFAAIALASSSENSGWVKSKESGKMRLEGKDYIVTDGDI
jgi:ribosome-binding ATPase YchF (GTP1/OBG family)